MASILRGIKTLSTSLNKPQEPYLLHYNKGTQLIIGIVGRNVSYI